MPENAKDGTSDARGSDPHDIMIFVFVNNIVSFNYLIINIIAHAHAHVQGSIIKILRC